MKGAFKQVDYLAQVLNYLQPILEGFALVTHQLRPAVEPLFIEGGCGYTRGISFDIKEGSYNRS